MICKCNGVTALRQPNFSLFKFKEFPNDDNVTKQETLPKGRNGKYKKRIPSDH